MNRERQNEIIKLLNIQQTVTNIELIEKFNISIETVRRDLAYLEKRGYLERVYGGAVKKDFLNSEPDYVNRQNKNFNEKSLIAKAAQKFINDKDSVFFDIGTTAIMVAENLESGKSISAYTNSLRLAIELSKKGCKVTVAGGVVRNGEFSSSGFLAEQDMQHFNFDKAIIGAAGIDESGVTDFIPEEANLRRQIIENSRRVILVADSSKLGFKAVCNVCPLSKIDVLITDQSAAKNVLKKLQKANIDVVIAK